MKLLILRSQRVFIRNNRRVPADFFPQGHIFYNKAADTWYAEFRQKIEAVQEMNRSGDYAHGCPGNDDSSKNNMQKTIKNGKQTIPAGS